jgi:hypothetical protein
MIMSRYFWEQRQDHPWKRYVIMTLISPHCRRAALEASCEDRVGLVRLGIVLKSALTQELVCLFLILGTRSGVRRDHACNVGAKCTFLISLIGNFDAL